MTILPIKIVYPNHYELIGRGLVLLACPPRIVRANDLYAGKIAEDAALLCKAPAIIANEGTVMGPSTDEASKSEFEARIGRQVEEESIKCILVVGATKEAGVEIQTDQTRPVAGEILELVKSAFTIDFDTRTTTGRTDSYGLSEKANPEIILLNFGPDERVFQREEIIASIADTIGRINQSLGYLESDQRPSDTLD